MKKYKYKLIKEFLTEFYQWYDKSTAKQLKTDDKNSEWHTLDNVKILIEKYFSTNWL